MQQVFITRDQRATLVIAGKREIATSPRFVRQSKSTFSEDTGDALDSAREEVLTHFQSVFWPILLDDKI